MWRLRGYLLEMFPYVVRELLVAQASASGCGALAGRHFISFFFFRSEANYLV